jgi:PAS domain S-box-containing protein
MALVTSPGPGGSLARRLALPAVLVPPLIALAIQLLRRVGLQDLPLAFALLAISIVPFTLVLVLRTAFSVERAHERSRRAEEGFRALINLAPDGIFIASLDGVYTDVNEFGARLLGRTRDEVVGMRILDLIAPDEEPKLAEARERLDREETVVGDYSLAHKDGHYIPVEVSACILADGRWLGFVRDIRARKGAERRLLEAHARERRASAQIEALANATVAVTEAVAAIPETDLRTVFQTIALQAQLLTDARYAALGVGLDPEVPFESWAYVGMSEEVARRIGRLPRPVGVLGEVARRGRVVRVPELTAADGFRGLPEGHPPLSSFLGVPIRYRGRPVGNLFLANKLGAPEFTADDQRMAEMLALRAATAVETARLYRVEALGRRWLQSVVDEMPDAVVITDGIGKVTLMNAAARAFAIDRDIPDAFGNLIGFEVRSPRGEPISPERQPIARAVLGELAREEILIRRRGGEWISALASGARVRGGDGSEGGAVVVLQDVTAMRELQRLREEWTSIVAHDLRQPVQLIHLSASALSGSGGALGPEQEKGLARIRAAAERITQMIGDLLDVSRIEAHQLALKRERVELPAWIEEAITRARGLTRGHPVRLDLRPPIPTVQADPARLEQILDNLLSNAAKYGEADSEIVVRVTQRSGEVEVAVTNRGEGLLPEDQALLFTRFYRTRAARAGLREGLGMGLYIAKGLVEAHGGRISVESTPGQETTFRFTLPAEAPVAAVEDAPHPR